jgi:hypothetical protein
MLTKESSFLASVNVSITVSAEDLDHFLFCPALLPNSSFWTYKNILAKDELKGRIYTAISLPSYLCY